MAKDSSERAWVKIVLQVIAAIAMISAAYVGREYVVNQVDTGSETTSTPQQIVQSGEKPEPQRAGALRVQAPFELSTYFSASGWMGDGEKSAARIQFDSDFAGKRRPGDSDGRCVKITYQPGDVGWAGVLWQYPDKNWGDQPGKKIIGASRITFWAAGEKGAEVVQFKAGGTADATRPYSDSFEAATAFTALTSGWRRYTIDLGDMNLSNVISGFGWIAKQSANPEGLTFYLDDIKYE